MREGYKTAVGKPSVISLFTGAGGLDLGFHEAGLLTAVAVEMDHRCCETLRANKSAKHPWEVIEAPVESVSSEEILARGDLKVGEADVLIGGPPCQPFSKSGYWARGDSGRLSDPRANTLGEYMRVLEDTQPRVFLLENVSGLAYSGKEEGFVFLKNEVTRINRKHGTKYKISAKVLNAAHFGVPQTRERIILVGDREGRDFIFPDPAFYDPDDSEAAEDGRRHGLSPYRTAWDALGDEAPEDLTDTKARGKWADLLPSVPEGLNYLHFTEAGASPHKLFGYRTRYWSFLLKLAKRRPSWTLTAQPGPAIGPFHWDSRRLARRELMRLQTFPEDYIVGGTLAQVHKQVGNAVPSLLGEVLARTVADQLLGKGSRPLALLGAVRRPALPATTSAVASKYLKHVGNHRAHPGTGKGPRGLVHAAE